MSQQPPWETQVGKPQQQPGWGEPQQQPGNGNQSPQGQPPTPPQGRPPYQPPPTPPGGQQPPPMPPYGHQQPPPPAYYPPPPSQQGAGPQYPQGPGQPYPQGPQYPQGPGQQYPQGGQDPHNPMTIIPPPPQFSQTPYGQPLTGFDPSDPKKKSRRGRRLAIFGAAGVLIAGVAVVGVITMQSKDKSSGDTSTKTAATPTTAATSSFPGNSYASTAAGGAADPKSLDSAATDKTPFAADGLVKTSFTDSKNVAYTLQSSGPHPCDKVGDAKVAKIVTSAKCDQFFAASWTDNAKRIVVSAMVIPYDDLATAAKIETQLGTASTGDYAQWCPADGPAAATCTKITSAATRVGKFGAFHRYLVITTAVYTDLRASDVQKDWVAAAADGAYQATLPNVATQ